MGVLKILKVLEGVMGVHPDDNISAEAACDNLESAILEDNDTESMDGTSLRPRGVVALPKSLLSSTIYYIILNKISESKSYSKASGDIRWVEAMNQEMEALNRNGTCTIIDLPIGRKPIGSKSLVSWKSKKQSMLVKSSTEAEYKAMNTVTCEVIWIQNI
ncbi:hypothetical protein Tco_0351302 [Tanacetum coccineum]